MLTVCLCADATKATLAGLCPAGCRHLHLITSQTNSPGLVKKKKLAGEEIIIQQHNYTINKGIKIVTLEGLL